MTLITSSFPIIGVDIGGTHITAAYIDPNSYEVISGSLRRQKVQSDAAADLILNSWIETLSSLTEKIATEKIRIGIAMPGPFNYENGVALFKGVKKYDSLYGVDVKTVLMDRLNLPEASIIFMNDAVAFLRGELSAGAAVGAQKAIGITLGTGLGSSSNCTGKVVDVNRAALPFKDQHAEEYLSSRWFLGRYKELTGKEVTNVEELLKVAEPGIKVKIFDEFTVNLARFINDFIADERPETLVIGGNLARTWDHFIIQLKEQIWHKHVLIKQTKMWENAALIGSASIWTNID